MLAVSLLLSALCSLAPAHPSGSSRAAHVWTTRDGLPQNSINDIAQGKDGVLWLATHGGVVRFDGQRFETFDVSSDPMLRTSRIMEVETDATGRLLVATGGGDVLLRYGPHWRTIELEGATSGEINELSAAPDGSTLIATNNGLFRLPPGSEHAELLVPGASLASAAAPNGRTLLATPGGLCELRGDEPGPPLVTSQIDTLIASPTGVFYMSGPSYAARLDSQGLTPLKVEGMTPTVLGVDRAGKPWLMVGKRTGWWNEDEERLQEEPRATAFLRDSALRTGFYDSAGRVWLGSDRSGLMCLAGSPLRGVSLKPEADYATAILSDSKGRIFSSAFGLQEVSLEGPRACLDTTPTRAASSAHGQPWLLGQEGLGRLDGNKLRVELPAASTPAPDGCMLEARDGTLLISSSEGLFRWNGSRLVRLETPGTDLKGFLSSLFEREDGSLALGGTRGVLLWNEGEVSTLLSGYEMPPGQVRAFAETRGGHLWIGTYGGGISSLSERTLTLIDRSRGLFENTASGLVPLDDEQLLVIGNRSVSIYPLAALEAATQDPNARVHGRSFDSGPGLGLFEVNCILQPRWARDAQGRIWMPTLQGAACFAPPEIPAHEPPPVVRVMPLAPAFKDVRHSEDGSATFVLDPDRREFQLRFSAASFAQPRQVHYRYRLVGQDPDWNTTSESDPTLTYSRLAPGDYTFEIQAAVADGEFGPVNRYYSVEVPHFWYELPWVRLGAVLTAFAFVGGLGLFRIRGVRQRNQQLEARVRERTLELESENQERRRVEEDLRKASEELEDKVALRTSELARALANLEWDMRRREKLEGRLRESEKLEAVGRLAGGLAHDFNNILTAILGEADLAQADLEVSVDLAQLREDLGEHLGNVRDAGMRAARLTPQLLAYRRQQVMQPEVVDPLETLRELRTMLERLVPDNVSIKIATESEHSRVLIDPGQLEQVVVNLVVNAAEAMPEGGEVLLGSRVEADKAIIEVTDSGIGLAAVDLERIFEPFFSTKGKARGLGLASVHGIVLQSGGSLDVKSEPGAGTTFHVSLPITTERASDELTPLPRPPAGGLRILLVDDEEDVRRVAKKMLERRGHRVLDSGDPKTALELAKRHACELDLLVTDVVMPHMNGKQLSRAVQAEAPGIRVLYISGYSTEVLSDREQLEAGANLLTKPFDSEALAARIAELG